MEIFGKPLPRLINQKNLDCKNHGAVDREEMNWQTFDRDADILAELLPVNPIDNLALSTSA